MVKSRGTSTTTVMTKLAEVVGPNRAMAPMIVPPDGGWGWVVVMVGLLSSSCTDGVVYCCYLFREPMSAELNIPQSDISYLSSLVTGFYFIGAVFACSFGNHWGFRTTMLLGGTIVSLSYSSGYFFHKMIYYYMTVGVMAGIGSGFVSIASNLPPGFYFDKKRSIAMGIVSCGSGLGGLVMPHLVELFMKHNGWRNSFLFEGGITAIVLLLGTLIRPLKPVMVVIDVASPQGELKREESIMDMSVFKMPSMLPTERSSYISMGKLQPVGESAPATMTIAKMANDVTSISIKVRGDSSDSVITRLHQMSQLRRRSQMVQRSASGEALTIIQVNQEPFIKQKVPWYKCGCCRSKSVYLPQRPLMRTDLYYTGSLHRLPEYNETDRDLDYHMQVTRVPTYYQTVQDLTKRYTIWCCYNVFNGLGYLVDYKMFKSLAFDCLAVCGFLIYFAFYMPYVFSKVHLDSVGAGYAASTLISLIGLGNFIGRLLSGLIITCCPRFDARIVCSATTFIAAVSIICMVLYDNVYYKGVCFFIYGFTIGFYAPLRSLIVVDYFGLEKLTSGTGVLILCLAAGSFMGSPIAENAMQYTKSRNTPFYVCGISLFIASASLWPMERINRWEKKRAEKRKRVGRTET